MLYTEPLEHPIRSCTDNHRSIQRIVMACYADDKHPLRLFVPQELMRAGNYGWSASTYPHWNDDVLTYCGIPMQGIPCFDQVSLLATDKDLADER
jgi:hypothetical protein